MLLVLVRTLRLQRDQRGAVEIVALPDPESLVLVWG